MDLAPVTPGSVEAPIRSSRRDRAEVAGDLLTLVAAVVFVQLAFPDRVDLAAHVGAGAGLGLVVAAAAPGRSRPWIAALSIGTCLGVAVIVELVQPGVLDYGDVAFTGTGSLLLARSTVVVAAADRRWRAGAALLGTAMIAAGLVARYAG